MAENKKKDRTDLLSMFRGAPMHRAEPMPMPDWMKTGPRNAVARFRLGLPVDDDDMPWLN